MTKNTLTLNFILQGITKTQLDSNPPPPNEQVGGERLQNCPIIGCWLEDGRSDKNKRLGLVFPLVGVAMSIMYRRDWRAPNEAEFGGRRGSRWFFEGAFFRHQRLWSRREGREPFVGPSNDPKSDARQGAGPLGVPRRRTAVGGFRSGSTVGTAVQLSAPDLERGRVWQQV